MLNNMTKSIPQTPIEILEEKHEYARQRLNTTILNVEGSIRTLNSWVSDMDAQTKECSNFAYAIKYLKNIEAAKAC